MKQLKTKFQATLKDLFIILLILVSLSTCSIANSNKEKSKENNRKSNNYMPIVSDTLVSRTLNYFIKTKLKDTIGGKYLNKTIFPVLSKEDSLNILRLTSIFTKADMDYIFKQNTNSRFFEINKFVENLQLVSADTLRAFRNTKDIDDFWSKFHEKYGDGGFVEISVPIFSLNRELIIIRYSYSCGGLCGSGFTTIFKKNGDEWDELRVLDAWIS